MDEGWIPCAQGAESCDYGGSPRAVPIPTLSGAVGGKVHFIHLSGLADHIDGSRPSGLFIWIRACLSGLYHWSGKRLFSWDNPVDKVDVCRDGVCVKCSTFLAQVGPSGFYF